jgi:MinD superfamily P-loop ATPase
MITQNSFHLLYPDVSCQAVCAPEAIVITSNNGGGYHAYICLEICISCGACLNACPNQAILTADGDKFYVGNDRCTLA